MKVLVLGGTGAMGRALVPILINRGHDVYVTSRSPHAEDQVHYILGNAHSENFIKQVLSERFDVIVDFMIYSSDNFRERVSLYLNSADQYMFLSSARVYADSKTPITEDSPRLLDVCKDDEYLKTDEYALAKAKSEDILFSSGQRNWTIIRPYITYNANRLQLGFMEKELWLNRALNHKAIVFSKDIADKYTTLTFGGDVAKTMADLIGNKRALGEAYNVMQEKAVKWFDVLNIYLSAFEEVFGKRPEFILTDDSDEAGKITKRSFQIKYDRLYNRVFDNTKVSVLSPGVKDSLLPKEGLNRCLKEFLTKSERVLSASWRYEGYADRVCGSKTSLSEISSLKDKTKYLLARYTQLLSR